MRRIKVERERRGWTQQELAKRTGIAQSDISQIERGKKDIFPSWSERLQTAFGMGEELFKELRP